MAELLRVRAKKVDALFLINLGGAGLNLIQPATGASVKCLWLQCCEAAARGQLRLVVKASYSYGWPDIPELDHAVPNG